MSVVNHITRCHDLLTHPRPIGREDYAHLFVAFGNPGGPSNPCGLIKEGDTPEYVASKVFGVSISEARRRGAKLVGPFACQVWGKWWVCRMGKKDLHPVFLAETFEVVEYTDDLCS